MRLLVWLMVLASVVATGCHQGTGSMTGERLVVEGCPDERTFEPFQLTLEYLGVLRTQELVQLRAGSTSEWVHLSDNLTIQVESYTQVQQGLSGPDASAELRVEDGDVAIGLVLNDTCPDSRASLVASRGVVRFTQFGTVSGEQIQGTLSGFDLINQRTGLLAGENFSAEIDFEVQSGTPHELFSDVGRQHGE